MVANYRCNELKEEALLLVEPSVNKLKQEGDRQLIPDFKEKCKEILRTSLLHYEDMAHQYD